MTSFRRRVGLGQCENENSVVGGAGGFHAECCFVTTQSNLQTETRGRSVCPNEDRTTAPTRRWAPRRNNRDPTLRFFRLAVSLRTIGVHAHVDTMLDRTVVPPPESIHELVAMLDTAGADRNTTLTGPNGEHLVVPPEIFEVLRRVVDAMANGQAVTIARFTNA